MGWAKTPFKSIEQAHATAERMGLGPSLVTSRDDGIRSFTVKEGRKTIVLAQKGDGPVLEQEMEKEDIAARYYAPGVPVLREEDRLQVGPWQLTEHSSLREAAEHYRSQFANPDNIEMVKIILFRDGDDEHEYAQDSRGVWARALHRKGK